MDILDLTTTVLPLLLGIAAWITAILGICTKKANHFPILSLALCACALWCPLVAIDRWVTENDVSAILDCAHGYLLCATALLAVTLVLNLLYTLRHRGK